MHNPHVQCQRAKLSLMVAMLNHKKSQHNFSLDRKTTRLICSETSTVIILNYNGWKDTLKCLNKIEFLATKPLRTIVVDNCSTDNSVEKILEYWQASHQAIVVHESELQNLTAIPESDNVLFVSNYNSGYAVGNNLGITLARLDPQCAAVWILNNDTEPDAMSLEYLCAALNRQAEAGAAGSTLVFANSDTVQCAGGASVNRWLGTTHSLKEFCNCRDVLEIDASTINPHIDFLTGASMLVRSEVFDCIGLIPEEYFLYYEDVDFGVNIKKSGFGLIWAKNSIVYHNDGSSTRTQKKSTPAWLDYLILRNRFYFIKKHYPLSIPTAIFGYLAVAFNRIRRNQLKNLKVIFPAIFDALVGAMGISERIKKLRMDSTSGQQSLSTNAALRFSLVVATYQRSQALDALLQSLVRQTYKNFEVVIVDQNQAGFLDDLMGKYQTALSIKYVRTEPKGVSQARNLGMAKAGGDVIAFPDDDCRYTPGTLERINDVLASHANIHGLLVSWTESPDPHVETVVTQVNKVNAFSNAGTLVQFYRKEALADILFDVELGPGTGLPYGCGEDTDFLLQVLASGRAVGRLKEELVCHALPNMDSPDLLKKTKSYARGRMQLLRKHKFPLWFKLANVAFPLFKAVQEGKATWAYRWAMFKGRLKGLMR